jgi:hypothetical protein
MLLFDDHKDLPGGWIGIGLSARLQKILDRYKVRIIERNHGVKDVNILRMLLPIGIQESQLSQTWLATMNSFGVERGHVAHSTHAVQTPPDPAVENTRVQQILQDLANVDRMITAVRQKRFPRAMFQRLELVSFGLSQARRR